MHALLPEPRANSSWPYEWKQQHTSALFSALFFLTSTHPPPPLPPSQAELVTLGLIGLRPSIVSFSWQEAAVLEVGLVLVGHVS